MPRPTSRKLEVFTIHAHFGDDTDQAVNYERLFQAIAETRRRQRIVTVLGKSLALPEFRLDENLVLLTAYEGEEGNPLFFNFLNATERIEELPTGEKLATKTHCAIDIERREAIVEYNHRGAKADDIAEAIQEIGKSLTGWGDLEVEFAPVIDQTFLQAINSFERIRSATVKMVRPNRDWTDHATYLTRLALESRGQTIDVTVSARKAQSLSKTGGLIGFIKQMARASFASLKSAKVVGTREHEDAETAVSLADHQSHQRVNVEKTPDGQVNDNDINNRLVNYLESRDPRNRQ
jgi:hypothetical protein